ncbi:MAG: hypothetical protein Aurels2KO_51150 [Aureliella sp.]
MKFLCSLIALLVFVTGCGSFAHRSERTVTESLETSPLEQLVLKTFNGAVTVKTHDEPTVELEVTYAAYGASEEEAEANCQQLSTEMAADNGKLSLTASKPSGQWNASASYKLTVPRNCSLDLNSSNGTIKVAQLIGDVKVKTSNGRIEIEKVLGNLTVDTSNGRVVVKDISGIVDVETSNGKIEYSGIPVGESSRLRSSNGSVIANVGLSSTVLVSASTSNGKISCVAEQYQEEPGGSKKRKSILIGDASRTPAKLTIRTSNGSIALGDYDANKASSSEEPPASEVDSSDFAKEEISE